MNSLCTWTHSFTPPSLGSSGIIPPSKKAHWLSLSLLFSVLKLLYKTDLKVLSNPPLKNLSLSPFHDSSSDHDRLSSESFQLVSCFCKVPPPVSTHHHCVSLGVHQSDSVHIYIYIYIYTHTHTHTHRERER